MTQHIARTSKGPIEYRFEGRGPTIVVLNGGHCSRETRLSHEKLTEHGFSVLTPSRPGYDSTPSEVGKSAQAAADALAALIDTLQIATVDVIGISAAGPTALAFVQQHPSRVRKLILESAVATDWDEQTKRRSRIPFGGAAKVTWAVMHIMINPVEERHVAGNGRERGCADVDLAGAYETQHFGAVQAHLGPGRKLDVDLSV